MDIGMPVSLIGGALIALIFFLVLLDKALYYWRLPYEPTGKGKTGSEEYKKAYISADGVVYKLCHLKERSR